MKSIKKLTLFSVLLFTLIFLTMPVVQVFSMPLFEPVVITFGNSPEVQVATSTVLENLPQARILKYEDKNSLFNMLTLMRSYSEIILAGHGSKEGILSSSGNILSWEVIGSWINSLPNSQVYLLACDSYSATTHLKKATFAFDGVIDGISGALAISAVINHNKGNDMLFDKTFKTLITRMYELKVNPENTVPLIAFPGLTGFWVPFFGGWFGPNEQTYDSVSGVMLIVELAISKLVSSAINNAAWEGLKRAAAAGALASLISLLVALVGAWEYGIDPKTGMDFTAALLNIIAAVGGLLFSFILPLLDFWTWLWVMAAFGISFSPAGWVITLGKIFTLASIALFVLGLLSDLTDRDDVSNLPFSF